MPTRERVKDLIAMVEQGRYVDAIQRFYAKDATMQENLGAVRQGVTKLMADEEKTLTQYKIVRTQPVKAFLVDGDRVVINWVFEFLGNDGRSFRLDELAMQRWSGDRIVEERFYYDPAQRRLIERRKSPRTAASAKPAK
jgi:hypothetical protein